MWYKAEAYIGSEYAGKYLHDNGLVPIYVSDNPVLNAQHLVLEAGKGYNYGLPYHVALAAVTTAPAERLGLGQRLGKVKPGFDADIVVWDSDPLSLGATPVQVWIDGAAQYKDPIELNKPFQGTLVPNEDLGKIVEDAVAVSGDIVFTGVSKTFLSIDMDDNNAAADSKTFNVAVSGGKITCIGQCHAKLKAAPKVIHLKHGVLTPAATAFGSTLGLNAIDSEQDTDNGAADANRPSVFSRAIDGLALDTEKLHASHRYGVTRAISAPKLSSTGATHHGTSAAFLTGATAPVHNAIFAADVAAHYTLDLSAKRGGGGSPSVSAAVGRLRDGLLEAVAATSLEGPAVRPFSEAGFLRRVVAGEMPLAVTVHSADTIAALLRVKADVETAPGVGSGGIRMVVVGGAEAHLLAPELAAAGVGVVLAPMLSYAVSWDQRRAMTGAPLTNGTAVDVLAGAGVLTAVGLEEDWVVRDLWLLAGIAYKNGEGRFSEEEALGLISRNVYKILGLEGPLDVEREHFVIHEGNPLEIGSRIKAVGGGTGKVDVY